MTNAKASPTAALEMWFQGEPVPVLHSIQFTPLGKPVQPIANLNAHKGPAYKWNKGVKVFGLFVAEYLMAGSSKTQPLFRMSGDKKSPCKTIYNSWEKDPLPWTQDVFGMDDVKQHTNFRSFIKAGKDISGNLTYSAAPLPHVLPATAIRLHFNGKLISTCRELRPLLNGLRGMFGLEPVGATSDSSEDEPLNVSDQQQRRFGSQDRDTTMLASLEKIPDTSLKSFLIAAINRVPHQRNETINALSAPGCLIDIAAKLSAAPPNVWPDFFDTSSDALPEVLLGGTAAAIVRDPAMRESMKGTLLREDGRDLDRWFENAAIHFPKPFVESMAQALYSRECDRADFSEELLKRDGIHLQPSAWLILPELVQCGCVDIAQKLLRLYSKDDYAVFRKGLQSPVLRGRVIHFLRTCKGILDTKQKEVFCNMLRVSNKTWRIAISKSSRPKAPRRTPQA